MSGAERTADHSSGQVALLHLQPDGPVRQLLKEEQTAFERPSLWDCLTL